MLLTVRLDNGNYLDLAIDVSKRTLTFLSPIPDVSREDLMELCDTYHYLLLLPISGEVIEPESLELTTDEIEKKYTVDTKSILSLLLWIANTIITEK